MKSYKRATYPQKRQIEDKLLEVLKLQSDGFYVYDKGWDDERVAKSVADYLSGAVTAGVRRSFKNPWRLRRIMPPRPMQSNANLNVRVARLERIINKLAANLGVDTETDTAEQKPVPKANGHLTIDDALDVLLS